MSPQLPIVCIVHNSHRENAVQDWYPHLKDGVARYDWEMRPRGEDAEADLYYDFETDVSILLEKVGITTAMWSNFPREFALYEVSRPDRVYRVLEDHHKERVGAAGLPFAGLRRGIVDLPGLQCSLFPGIPLVSSYFTIKADGDLRVDTCELHAHDPKACPFNADHTGATFELLVQSANNDPYEREGRRPLAIYPLYGSQLETKFILDNGEQFVEVGQRKNGGNWKLDLEFKQLLEREKPHLVAEDDEVEDFEPDWYTGRHIFKTPAGEDKCTKAYIAKLKDSLTKNQKDQVAARFKISKSPARGGFWYRFCRTCGKWFEKCECPYRVDKRKAVSEGGVSKRQRGEME